MKNTRRIATCALLSAIGYISLWLIRIPIIPAATFLRFDVKDVFIALMGIIYGPMYTFAGAICISLLQTLSVSEYGVIGFIMNILSASAFSLPIALVYKKGKNGKRLILGLVIGTISLIVIMLFWNYLVTPLYMGIPRSEVKGMIVPIFLPFNFMKGIINSILIYIVYGLYKKILKNNKGVMEGV